MSSLEFKLRSIIPYPNCNGLVSKSRRIWTLSNLCSTRQLELLLKNRILSCHIPTYNLLVTGDCSERKSKTLRWPTGLQVCRAPAPDYRLPGLSRLALALPAAAPLTSSQSLLPPTLQASQRPFPLPGMSLCFSFTALASTYPPDLSSKGCVPRHKIPCFVCSPNILTSPVKPKSQLCLSVC